MDDSPIGGDGAKHREHDAVQVQHSRRIMKKSPSDRRNWATASSSATQVQASIGVTGQFAAVDGLLTGEKTFA
jgi:hypothetical protein